MSKKRGLGKLLAGVGIGVGIGLLFAPQSGEKTRKDLKKKADELCKQLKEIDYNEVKDNLVEKIQNLQDELADLDKEKVVEIAKIKAEEIKKPKKEVRFGQIYQVKTSTNEKIEQNKETKHVCSATLSS